MSELNPEDPLPALLAALDQVKATAPLLAQHAYTLYQALSAEGFTSSEALYLTAELLHSDPERPA